MVSDDYATRLSDLAVRDQDDYVPFNPSDSRVDPPEVTYSSDSNIATFTYDMSSTYRGFYSEDFEVLIGLPTFNETIAEMTRSDGSLDTWYIETFIPDTLTEMGFGGWRSVPYGLTLSELPSWYEQNYVVQKLQDGSWVTVSDAEKPSWSELEQAFNEKQSILSIDDNQMILNSTGTSDTEVTFSANLDDLETFINDPSFYFTVNGDLVFF